MDTGEPSTTLVFNNFYTLNATGHLKFTMTFPGSYSGNSSKPALYKAPMKRERFTIWLEWDPNRALFNLNQVYNVGSNKTVRIVVNNPTLAQNAHRTHTPCISTAMISRSSVMASDFVMAEPRPRIQ